MRRKDRELKDMADIVSIAKRETVCTVAFHDEPCPYLIPLNYGADPVLPWSERGNKTRQDQRKSQCLILHLRGECPDDQL